MNFFKRDDFLLMCKEEAGTYPVYTATDAVIGGMALKIAKYANDKLERESEIAYGRMEFKTFAIAEKPGPQSTHKALLINIEPIEKCKHGNLVDAETSYWDKGEEKTLASFHWIFTCECGAKVKPTVFEEIK